MLEIYLKMCAIVMAFTLVWGVYNIAQIIIKAHKKKRELEVTVYATNKKD